MRIHDLEKYVFKGLLLEDTLQTLHEAGYPNRPSQPSEAEVVAQTADFSPRVAYDASLMAAVYLLFHMFENSVRQLITERLAETHGAEWWTKKVPKKIQDSVTTLKTKEGRAKHRTPRSTSDIGYTTFGQLANIIDACWSDFEDLFPDQHFVKSRLDDAEGNRNVLMHTGLLPPEEIDRLHVVVRDWLRHVG